MGRMDSSSANLKAVANAPEPVDRLNLLSRWIGAKLEEIGQAEERINKRLEHLNATEQSLKNLFELLRKQVADTQPVLKDLTQLRASAVTAVEQVVRASKDRSANSLQASNIDQKLEERLTRQVSQCEQQIAAMVTSALESMSARAAQLHQDLSINSGGVDKYLEHRLLTAQKNADAIANRVMDQLNVAQSRANEISRSVDLYATEAISRLSSQCEAMFAPFQQRLSIQLEEMETRVTSEMSSIEETTKAQLNGFYLHLDQVSTTLQGQLEQIANDFKQSAETTLASSRATVRQQVDAIAEEVRMAVRPALQLIDDRRISAEKQTDAAISGMEEAMKIRLVELRRSGESIIQLVESQLIEKLKLIRPQAQSAIESAEKHVTQRMQAAIDSARSTVELNERQLADRIEELRPRVSAALQSAKTVIDQQIASLESEATTATGWIEQRLSHRIDELTYRARKTVNEQIRELDDASERLRRQGGSDRMVDGSGQPVEVDIHVQNENAQQRSNAA